MYNRAELEAKRDTYRISLAEKVFLSMLSSGQLRPTDPEERINSLIEKTQMAVDAYLDKFLPLE